MRTRATGQPLDQPDTQRVGFLKSGAALTVRTDAAAGFGAAAKGRTFNLIPDLEGVSAASDFGAGKNCRRED